MLKKELRAKYKGLRKQLRPELIDQKSLAIKERITEHIDFTNKTISLFLTIKKHNEINTNFIHHYLTTKNCKITAPRSNFETLTLEHILIEEDTTIKENSYGIPEPFNGEAIDVSELDIVFVPFLAINDSGYRVGYGKGFYDRFLAQCKPSCLFIGLHLFDSFETIDDLDESDIPVHMVITPHKITHFKSS